MNQWLKTQLVCPRDKTKLELKNERLICSLTHSYPVFDGIPVMLIEETEPTHGYITSTLEKVSRTANEDRFVEEAAQNFDEQVDKFVQGEIVNTCGNLYFPVLNNLNRYPIPELRLAAGNGASFLDVGCNWGRWSVSAAQKGYKPVGLDPSLDSVLAARRVAKQLNVEADFVCGDARFLPFADDSFDVVFSYSVYQHFSKENARISFAENARVLKSGGTTFVQMPNKYGIRQFYNHWRSGFTEGDGFEVRYWSPNELMQEFTKTFGATTLTVDGFFGLGIQKSDADLLPLKYKLVVYSSEILRKTSEKLPFIKKAADSVYLESVNQK
jgi:SAM-dependent methyltransferase/uncharacterized protein YbaR (Trm112 family)